MLGTASFYKATPEIMPKAKRLPSAAVSPVSKKRRVRQNGGILVEKNDALQSDWTPQVVIRKLPSPWSPSSGSNMDSMWEYSSICKPSLMPVGRRCKDTISSPSKEAPGKMVVASVKSENDGAPRRTSARVQSMRAFVKKEEVKIKQEEGEEESELLGNTISDDEDSDDSDDEMSAYEKKRLQNIQENAKFFASLGISKTKDTLSQSSKKQSFSTRGLQREKAASRKVEPLPRRPLSLRLRRLDPEGVALPDVPYQKFTDEIPAHVRKPSGPLDMQLINRGGESEENSTSRLFKSITSLSKSPKSPRPDVHPQDLAAFTATLQSMTLTPERVAKVTKDRVFSAAVHPSPAKIIACAGDKWGKVGVWDVECQEGDDGVYLFEPHSRPVSCLKFAPKNPAKLYSCSYDGTVRCGDFERGIFDEIHTTGVDADVYCSHFDFLSPDGVKLLVSQNQQHGYVQVVDTRLKRNNRNTGFQVHNRYVKTVNVHPSKPEYFVTSSTDSTVALWDVRTLKEHGLCKNVSSIQHGRSVSAAYFSPITGSKIVTTAYDNKIRILQVTDSGKLELHQTIRHDNQTGRWLTTFRTAWHPRRDDVIVVGSLDRPRRIQFFDTQGHLLHDLMGDELASVCSVNVWHPTRDIVIGANASGRLHVFM